MRMPRFKFEPQFSTESSNDEAGIYRRIEESYMGWCFPVPAHQMIQARFYCTGQGDRVGCFHCGLGLCGWEEGDDPFEQHRRWSPNCRFILTAQMSRPPPSQNDDEEAMDEAAATDRVVSLQDVREENARLRERQDNITDTRNAVVAIEACEFIYPNELVNEADRIYLSRNAGRPALRAADLATIINDLEDASLAGDSLSAEDTSQVSPGADSSEPAPAVPNNMRQEVPAAAAAALQSAPTGATNRMWNSLLVPREVDEVMSNLLRQVEEDAAVAGGSLPEDEEGAAAASLPLNFKNGLKRKP